MPRIVLVILLAHFALFPAGIRAAATPAPGAYEVEVLVFEQRLPDLEANEQWTTGRELPIPTVGDAITLGATPLGADLSAAAAGLQNDARYRVLLHRRWVQGADGKTTSKSILLGSENEELFGYLRFYMSRYLHVELNLVFRPGGGAVGTEQNDVGFRLIEQRRIKSLENHYFDHPKFGALVRVSPAATAALGGDR